MIASDIARIYLNTNAEVTLKNSKSWAEMGAFKIRKKTFTENQKSISLIV